MVMAPARLGSDVAAHTAFFQNIGKATGIPILLQNAPGPNGAGLSPEAVAEIARAVEAVEYVKEETLPCGQNLSRIQAAAGASIRGVFGGAGARYVTDELARGAVGTMPASELTDVHVDLVEAWRRGDEATARRLYAASLPLLTFQAVFRMAMSKEVLRRRGVIQNVFVRAKGPRLDDRDRRELDLLLHEAAELPRTRPWVTRASFQVA
jgi:4-hydroxy-tetrahydrodipicolinate synthase